MAIATPSRITSYNVCYTKLLRFVESERLSLDWQHTLAFSEHTVTAGLFAMQESAKTLSFGSGFDEDTDVNRITSYNVCYTKLVRLPRAVRPQ